MVNINILILSKISCGESLYDEAVDKVTEARATSSHSSEVKAGPFAALQKPMIASAAISYPWILMLDILIKVE